MLFEKNEKIDAIGLGAELYLKTLRESRQALARQESMVKAASDRPAFVEVSPNRVSGKVLDKSNLASLNQKMQDYLENTLGIVNSKALDKSYLTPEGSSKINSPEPLRNLIEEDIINAAEKLIRLS
jgi:hypothetical protein